MKRFPLFIPWLLVCVAMVGSIFFSKLHKLEPCTLCWYQRMMIFPLAIILGIAAFRNAYRIILYVLPLTLIGLGIAIYHVMIVYVISGASLCSSCTLKPTSSVDIPFPLMSLGLFILLNASLIWIYLSHRKSKKL